MGGLYKSFNKKRKAECQERAEKLQKGRTTVRHADGRVQGSASLRSSQRLAPFNPRSNMNSEVCFELFGARNGAAVVF